MRNYFLGPQHWKTPEQGLLGEGEQGPGGSQGGQQEELQDTEEGGQAAPAATSQAEGNQHFCLTVFGIRVRNRSDLRVSDTDPGGNKGDTKSGIRSDNRGGRGKVGICLN